MSWMEDRMQCKMPLSMEVSIVLVGGLACQQFQEHAGVHSFTMCSEAGSSLEFIVIYLIS